MTRFELFIPPPVAWFFLGFGYFGALFLFVAPYVLWHAVGRRPPTAIRLRWWGGLPWGFRLTFPPDREQNISLGVAGALCSIVVLIIFRGFDRHVIILAACLSLSYVHLLIVYRLVKAKVERANAVF